MQLDSIAHVIQLSAAPVFLLVGAGAILGVQTSRLVRIVDRARDLESRLKKGSEAPEDFFAELRILSSRLRLINWAISLCVTCALLIASVIVTLFGGAFWAGDISIAAAVLFVAALLALIAGLLCFLREIYLSIASLRIGPY